MYTESRGQWPVVGDWPWMCVRGFASAVEGKPHDPSTRFAATSRPRGLLWVHHPAGGTRRAWRAFCPALRRPRLRNLGPAMRGPAITARPRLPPRRLARSIRRRLGTFLRGYLIRSETYRSAKILRYAQRLVEQYDTNHDGYLEKEEWQQMRGNPAIVDRDHDGLITVEDLARYITIYGRYRHIQLLAPALVTSRLGPTSEGAVAGCRQSPRRQSNGARRRRWSPTLWKPR